MTKPKQPAHVFVTCCRKMELLKRTVKHEHVYGDYEAVTFTHKPEDCRFAVAQGAAERMSK